jgi:putative transposase
MIDWIDEVGPGRKGAFWEDRYPTAAIESGEHLLRCQVYIDLNMVRAGAVSHPQEWVHGGYREIQGQRRRNRLLDPDALVDAAGMSTLQALADHHGSWVSEALRTNPDYLCKLLQLFWGIK